VLPVRWSDNQVSLWPGEKVTLTAAYRTADLGGAAPAVQASGWNIEERPVPT
jgi:exo-1,4-beta-D-glucosaminidase